MADQNRVTFRFGRELEVQYLAREPTVGDHVTHGRELWVVTDVQRDASGPIAVCERASGGGPPIGGEHGQPHTAWRR